MSSIGVGRARQGSSIRLQRAKQQRSPPNVSTESIESIASQPSAPPAAPAAATCAACGAPLAGDQRYCLQCGERTAPISSLMLGGTLAAAQASPAASPAGAAPPAPGPPGVAPASPLQAGDPGAGGNALTVIAGVGVLLLAMGVGVLIGRSGGSKPGAAPPQVITVSSAPGAGTTAPESEAFAGDWPAGSSGYTVQLRSLPVASTQASAVQAAKSAAEGKGAKAVGALKSDEFAGLPAGRYIVYSGRYAKKGEAQKALAGLRKSFPGASVVHVGAGASGGKGAGSGSIGGGKSGVGQTPSNPAPPSSVEALKGKSGQSYEQESKNLPNVVSTG
jgi:hypothetical protein